MEQTTKTRIINFKGHITSLQPITVATPDSDGMAKDRNGCPYLSANSIRGKIRHSAVDAMQTLRVSGGQPAINVDEIYMLSQGTDTARQFERRTDGSVEVGSNQKYRDANRHMSLYGRWGLQGRLQVGNAYTNDPKTLVKVGDGSRSHVFQRSETLMGFVSPEEVGYLEDIFKADGNTAEKLKDINKEIKTLEKQLRAAATKEEKDSINNQIKLLEEEIRSIKDARVGASESIRRPIEAFEAIDANVEMVHSFRLLNPTDEELYYFLWCLAMTAYNPVIGGRASIGCGEFRGDWEVTEFTQGQIKPKVIGHVSLSSDGFECDVPGFDADAISQAITSGEIDLRHFV